jgi:hypothetical protein
MPVHSAKFERVKARTAQGFKDHDISQTINEVSCQMFDLFKGLINYLFFQFSLRHRVSPTFHITSRLSYFTIWTDKAAAGS